MKKIPKVITRLELMKAYGEGKQAYHEGKRRGYNPYPDKGQDELAAAWWKGWDDAQNKSHGERQL